MEALVAPKRIAAVAVVASARITAMVAKVTALVVALSAAVASAAVADFAAWQMAVLMRLWGTATAEENTKEFVWESELAGEKGNVRGKTNEGRVHFASIGVTCKQNDQIQNRYH